MDNKEQGRFNIDTERGTYDCLFVEDVTDGEKRRPGYWVVNASFTKVCTATFNFPEQWARARVFQFLNSIDKHFE